MRGLKTSKILYQILLWLLPPCNDLVSDLNARLKETLPASVKWKKKLHAHKNPWINEEIRRLKRNWHKSELFWRTTKLHYDIPKADLHLNNAMKRLSAFAIYFQNDVLTIVNCSLSTDAFPDAFKTALLKLPPKTSSIDLHILNFRPIPNLLLT